MAQNLNERPMLSSYVDVPAVLGGTMLALAISLVLTNFAAALGLSFIEDTHWNGDQAWTRDEAIAGVIAGGLWIVWTQVTASMLGGYIAGRLRRPISTDRDHEREIRDGAHGALVWATGTVAVAIAIGFASAIAALNEPGAAAPRQLTDSEHNAAIILAFITAASALVSGVAAWWAAAPALPRISPTCVAMWRRSTSSAAPYWKGCPKSCRCCLSAR